MSHNTDPERAARRHPGPIIAIVVALIVAALAAFWFSAAEPEAEGDVSRISAPGEPVDTPAMTPADPAVSAPAASTPEPAAPASPATN